MQIGKLWAGKVFGTNTGNLFIRLEGEEKALKGSLHHNDPDAGIAVYDITASFDGSTLSMEGKPRNPTEGVPSRIKATARLQSTGNLEGQWESDIGSAGTFVLFPHDRGEVSVSGVPIPDQMHTARYNLGPVEIDREQVIALGDDLQRGFTKGKVVVTFVSGTEQSRFLEDFKRLSLSVDRAELLKLFVRESDGSGIDKSITVEFGQTVNWAMCQGASEAWVLGELERLKRELRRFERTYATRAVGVGINQIMAICTIVFLPSLENLRDRAILTGGVITLAYAVTWLHNRYLPYAAIYLGKRKEGWLTRLLPSVFSWLIGIAASVIATLLGVYLKGWLALPGP